MKVPNFSKKGVALPTVIMVMLVAMTLGCIALTMVTSQAKTEVIYENNINALHAAEAGANQYLWFINKEHPTPILFDTEIKYPEIDPVSAFILTVMKDERGEKVIKSTGWSLSDVNTTRTIEVTFTKRSFTEYVYLSNDDPDNIWWMTDEKCYGPYHTNTSLRISGDPEFFSKVTYVKDLVYQEHVTSEPVFHDTVLPADPAYFPSNNTALYDYAEAGGYRYTGRTSIRLLPDGRIIVWNPGTGPIENPPVTRPLPPNGVIYVNGTTVSDTDKFNKAAGNVFISGVLNGQLTVAAKNDIYITDIDPTIKDYNIAKNAVYKTDGIKYADTDFDVNTGTGDITLTGPGQDDMLGLVADNNVSILTRGWFNDSDAASALGNLKIYGAIFAIKGSFVNSSQINSIGSTSYPSPAGILTVRGSIIQNKRGAVGVTTDGTKYGYSKDYAHDPRMKCDTPPFFLEVVNAGWEINIWKEK